MFERASSRPDLLLLLSLLLVILVYPTLDHGTLRRAILGALMFLPVIVATLRLSNLRGWLWPSVGLMLAALILTVVGMVLPVPAILGIKWSVLAVFFGLTATGLFSYLRVARSITVEHLYTAVSIYLLIGITWFGAYNAIDILTPGAIVRSGGAVTDRSTEL